MSSIPLARPTPRRIVHDGRDWTLEVVRYHPIDRDVFSPLSSFVLGTEAILRHLAELVDDSSVVSDSRALLAKPARTGTAYEFIDGRWHAQARVEEPPSLTSLPDQTLALQEQVADLEARLVQLATRLLELENAQASRRPRAHVSSLPPPREDLPGERRETG